LIGVRRVAAAGAVARAIIFMMTLVWAAQAGAQSRCSGPTSGVPEQTIAALARGINVSNWTENARLQGPRPELLRIVRSAGFTHIRLPVAGDLVMHAFSPQVTVERQLAGVDAALTELIGLGFHVSVDLHPGEGFGRLHRDDPKSSMAAMIDAWSGLARVIRKHPVERVFAELLNEPDVAPDRWQSEVEQLAAFVRGQLPQTTLIVGPTYWQRADSLPQFRPLADRNVVYALHFYDPMVFTHQGHWDPANPLSRIHDLPFPLVADDPAVVRLRSELIARGDTQALQAFDKAIAQSGSASYVARQLVPAVAWQERYARPLIINEFGVFKQAAPRDSRLRWLESVVDSAEANCWGWTYWELDQGFGLTDPRTGRLDADVIDALMHPR
jgi:endoglucanase